MADKWMDAQDALALMTAVKKGAQQEAKDALLKLLKSGAIRSVATTYDGNPPGLSELDLEADYEPNRAYYRLNSQNVALTNDFWGLIEWRGNVATVDWEFGIFAYSYYPRGRNCKQFETASGVRLEESALRRLVGETAWQTFFSETPNLKSSATPSFKNAGGRPPAAFADDLMCAVWASIYRGDFKPKRQADIEKALKTWAVSHGHELGDTSARDKARKVWISMHQEVENPGE